MTFVSKLKGFLSDPTTTFGAVKEDTLSGALKYALICLVILGATVVLPFSLFFLLNAATMGFLFGDTGGPLVDPGSPVLYAPVTIGFSIVAGMLFIFIASALTHLPVYLLGRRQGHSYRQTLKAVLYGATPVCVVGWVPLIGLFAGGIWALVVTVIGLRELHGITTGRAVAACLPSIVTFCVIVGLLISALLGLFSDFLGLFRAFGG